MGGSSWTSTTAAGTRSTSGKSSPRATAGPPPDTAGPASTPIPSAATGSEGIGCRISMNAPMSFARTVTLRLPKEEPSMSARFTPVILLVSAVALLAGVRGVSGGAARPPAITVSGFQTPESVLYDPTADLYLVANINGNPAGTDDNGFISRVTPAGQVQTLKWIDGASASVTLNAPKGMAIAGDTLYVADITAVRMFDRTTGQAKGAVNVPGATFLNDAAAGPDGSVYVTDTGLNPDFSPNGTHAVYP